MDSFIVCELQCCNHNTNITLLIFCNEDLIVSFSLVFIIQTEKWTFQKSLLHMHHSQVINTPELVTKKKDYQTVGGRYKISFVE